MKLFDAEMQFHLNRNPAVDTAHLAPKVVPFEAELEVDGTRINVSERTRLDGLYVTRPTILEIKTGVVRIEDKLAVAGYALAYESHTNTPIAGGIQTLQPSGHRSHLSECTLDRYAGLQPGDAVVVCTFSPRCVCRIDLERNPQLLLASLSPLFFMLACG